MIRILLTLLALAVLALGYSLWAAERADNRADKAEAAADQAIEALSRANDIIDTERAKAATLADIGTQHEEDRREAGTVPAAVAADLRAGNLRLRKEWAGCETQRLSDATAAAIERDALAQLRDEAAGDLVRVVRDADNHVRACQAVVTADRSKP